MPKEIPLTQGKVAIVDDGDWEWLMQWKWFAWHNSKCWYARRSIWIVGKGNGGSVLMHRAITGAPMGIDVDHKDGDGLMNVRSNLRLATRSQNMANSRRDRPGTASIYKGVGYRTSVNAIRARKGIPPLKNS